MNYLLMSGLNTCSNKEGVVARNINKKIDSSRKSCSIGTVGVTQNTRDKKVLQREYKRRGREKVMKPSTSPAPHLEERTFKHA
jgi:hypothetical protein